MEDNNLNNVNEYQAERVSHYSDKIDYDPSSALNAMRCLLNMQKYEDIPNFGKIGEHTLSSRYDIKDYSDKIDSTFYTDMATSILGYTMLFFNNNYNDFGDTFDDEFSDEYFDYISDEQDLVNDSDGEFSNFEGDVSFGQNSALGLYAYYSEFQLVENGEREDIINRLDVSDISNEIVIKKTENINGVDMDFYYVSENNYGLSQYLLNHDYNTKFYSDRMPGNVLNAIVSDMGANDIITITSDYYNSTMPMEYFPNGYAAYADYDDGKCIVVQGNYFTEVICHETGHLFDRLNSFSLGGIGPVDLDYSNFLDLGRWDRVAEKYADDIATIRIGADIGCGGTPDVMREQHWEFYAEAFQLYFYSEETRAALPNAVREKLENEIEKYA